MDIIFIRELRIETTIGVHPWERQIRQTLILDLELGADTRPAAVTDCLDDTLNYQAVAQRVSEFAAANAFQLVETLGERIAELLRQEFGTPWLRLTVRKPGAVRSAREVGIIIERGCRD
ncbi:MAG: dihydroneopterin aldolase [Candidatus Competibacteraceae bacterium]|uniref:7,8-dihydroneopterin aldolase n=1 Tax=Candidatus Contendobacter odensis Run_B_J11 TaxID=1400861 RepID=A0A7U7G9K8_9GAMM|nr:dihydroneopterin aldolase [Candidatus Contendobacter odensis]MBK8535562.1 dihydroneopterin aldolase [Candidatus Competibacteraceae bacterium]CDH44000.1 dihydroneopterin aldolase, also has dihydroneopterin triphosphate 2'-epimerase activity [Candidatus Contendobacter odensis Run_B_J11]